MPLRRQHDVYDDTPYGEQRARRGSSRSSRHTHHHYQHQQQHQQQQQQQQQQQEQQQQTHTAPYYPQPPAMQRGHGAINGDPFFGSMMAPFDMFAPHHQHHQHHQHHHQQMHNHAHAQAHAHMQDPFGMMMSPFGAFGSVMESMDRMVDEMNGGINNNNNSNSSFFYESRTRTVGPDGRVHEEVVRTAPGADGNPETTRQVHDGNNESTHMFNHGQDGRIEYDGAPQNDDVIVEELDEYGNVVNSSVEPQQQEHQVQSRPNNDTNGNEDGRPNENSWWYNRFRPSRGNRV